MGDRGSATTTVAEAEEDLTHTRLLVTEEVVHGRSRARKNPGWALEAGGSIDGNFGDDFPQLLLLLRCETSISTSSPPTDLGFWISNTYSRLPPPTASTSGSPVQRQPPSG
jgi:hypothetical protein